MTGIYTRVGRNDDFLDGWTGKRLRLVLLGRGMEDLLKLVKVVSIEIRDRNSPGQISEIILDAGFESNS